MTYYLDNGGLISVANSNLKVSEALPPWTYTISQDEYKNFYLKKIESLEVPSRVYGDSIKLKDRILNTFVNRQSSLGVLLLGTKGSGKTLLSKLISVEARQKGIPTIVINQPYIGDNFNTFIQNIDTECVIIFDEFEKVYDRDHQKHVLTLLDGVYNTKKLFIITANDQHRLDENLINRPGRAHYSVDYNHLDKSFIEEYAIENLIDKEKIKALINICKQYDVNFDMLRCIVDEINLYNETPTEAIKYLNIKHDRSYQTYNVVQFKFKDIELGFLHTRREIDIITQSVEINILEDDLRLIPKETLKTFNCTSSPRTDELKEVDGDFSIEFYPSNIISMDLHEGVIEYLYDNEFYLKLEKEKISYFRGF